MKGNGRDSHGRFLPGWKGGGRKPFAVETAAELQALIKSNAPDLVAKAIAIALNDEHPQQVRALGLLLNKAIPDAVQKIEPAPGEHPAVSTDEFTALVIALVRSGDPRICTPAMLRLAAELLGILPPATMPGFDWQDGGGVAALVAEIESDRVKALAQAEKPLETVQNP